MVEFTPNDIILVIGAGSAALASIVVAIQKSRCSEIDCCCFKCKRQVPQSSSPNKRDVESQNVIT
jgi:hypothetical protein